MTMNENVIFSYIRQDLREVREANAFLVVHYVLESKHSKTRNGTQYFSFDQSANPTVEQIVPHQW